MGERREPAHCAFRQAVLLAHGPHDRRNRRILDGQPPQQAVAEQRQSPAGDVEVRRLGGRVDADLAFG